MSSNALFVGWNRPVVGRERMAAEDFSAFTSYLSGLQQKGVIKSFDCVFLHPHGGDLNGFFVIRGDPQRLGEIGASSEWNTQMIRASIHLEGLGVIRGLTGELVKERMTAWAGMLPPQ
jgi:hypothetical protein